MMQAFYRLLRIGKWKWKDIVATTLWPDMVLWPLKAKPVHVVELTLEDGVEEAYERKKTYFEL